MSTTLSSKSRFFGRRRSSRDEQDIGDRLDRQQRHLEVVGATERHRGDDDQRQQAQDVVEHGGAEDDVDRATGLYSQIAQHTYGDADRGRHQRRRHEQALGQIEAKRPGEEQAGAER
jgi:hypothetical protein